MMMYNFIHLVLENVFGQGCSLVVEYLPSMCEALSSIPRVRKCRQTLLSELVSSLDSCCSEEF